MFNNCTTKSCLLKSKMLINFPEKKKKNKNIDIINENIPYHK